MKSVQQFRSSWLNCVVACVGRLTHQPVKTYLETLNWAVFPYSADIAPSDYYLFRSMTHDLADQQFCSYEDIEKWLDSWIVSKDEHFYRNGIRALPGRWAKVVANDG